jgi:DNA-binding NarL/FixJ family response regulator
MSNPLAAFNPETLKFLIAISEPPLRRQVIALVRSRFSNSVVYEAKDGGEALQKIESDLPHFVVLGTKLGRRSPLQIVTSLYQAPQAQDVRTILLGSLADDRALQDFVAAGKLQQVPMGADFGPFLVALYNAVNGLRATDSDFKIRYMQSGELLLREGEKGERLYLLMKGRLTAYVGNEASPKVLGRINPGEFVGEMAYINREPRVASVKADEDSELVEFSIDTFDQILYRKPSWMKALLQTLSRRVKSLNSRKLAG